MWGEFPDFPQLGKMTSFKAIERHIASQNKQITGEPLRLEIYSPNVVDLRLVDLPGLIHVRFLPNYIVHTPFVLWVFYIL